MDALRTVAIAASDMGVKVLTVYAFSTETGPSRSGSKFIMNLPVEFYDKYVPELHQKNMKIQMMGRLIVCRSRLLMLLKKAERAD